MMQPNFIPFPELETERVLLRKISLSDAPEIFILRSDENVLRFIGKEPATTIYEAETFIKMINDNIATGNAIMWGISLKNNPEKLIGNICFWNFQKENYRTEIGYALHPAYWRQGIMKETINKIIEYGFSSLGLHSIEALLSAGNTASAAILEATGFVKEGYLKENFYFRGKFSDTIIYSRLQ